jgi:hypothetical protein
MAMHLELAAEERDLLVEILERALAETRVEARHTADRGWRDRLRNEEERLRALIERLRGLG